MHRVFEIISEMNYFKKMIYRTLFFLLVSMVAFGGVTHMGAFRDTWHVYKVTDARGAPEQCYIRGVPEGVATEGDAAAMPESYILLTRKVAGGAVMPVGVATGHGMDPARKVKLTFGEKNYYLQSSTVGAWDTAWSIDERQERQLLKEMQRGRTLQVTSETAAGEIVEVTYSLLGFAAAVDALESACFPQKVHGSGALKKSALQKIDLRGAPAKPKPATQVRDNKNPRPPVIVEIKIDHKKK